MFKRGFAFACLLAAAGSAASAQSSGPQVDTQAVVNACLTPEQQARAIADFSAGERLAMMACLQRESASQLNSQLPYQVDELTVLQRITTDNARLTYHYKVAVDSGQVSAEQRANIIRATRNNVCGKADMRRTISMGGAYGYVWIDSKDVEIARTVVESC